jgi:hypothetical protein
LDRVTSSYEEKIPSKSFRDEKITYFDE